jgi:hypothetical protein
MKHAFLASLATALVVSFTAGASAMETGDMGPISDKLEARIMGSSALLRQAGRCARNPHCRKEVAEDAERLALRIRKLAVELAISGAEQIYALLGKAIEAPDNKEVLARLDELEAQLASRGIECPELERELRALRANYQ